MKNRDFTIVSSLINDIQIVHQSDYGVIGYSPKHEIIYHEWFEDAMEIDDETFKLHSLNLFNILEKYRPVFFLVNDKKRKLSISSEINEFLVMNFQPIYAHPKMKKVALISNEKLSIQGQAENAMEDVDKSTISNTSQFAFFIDVTQAVEWLGLDK